VVAFLATFVGAAHAGPDKAKPVRPAQPGQELVGKWCSSGPSGPNDRDGASILECFQLNADGTYVHAHEGSITAALRSPDFGRWSYRGSVLTAQSHDGRVATYALEKRNHPKNPSEPMICLNGDCFVARDSKPPW
jgi:hypothetical protein